MLAQSANAPARGELVKETAKQLLDRLREITGTPHCGLSQMVEAFLLHELWKVTPEDRETLLEDLRGKRK
jgi:hypothetical protein